MYSAAYDEGLAAAQAGESFLANPYPVGSAEHERWATGYTDGEE